MEEFHNKLHNVHEELRYLWRRRHFKKCNLCKEYHETTIPCRFCRNRLCFECSFIKVVVCESCHIDRRIIGMLKNKKKSK